MYLLSMVGTISALQLSVVAVARLPDRQPPKRHLSTRSAFHRELSVELTMAANQQLALNHVSA